MRYLRILPLIGGALLGIALASGCIRPRSPNGSQVAMVNNSSDPAAGLLAIKRQGPAPAPGTTPVSRNGQLSVRGAELVNASGQPVALHGQAFGWDNWWPQYYNADVVRWLRDDWCVDVVRPAMGIEPSGAYLSNPTTSKQHITAVVDAAIESGIYVIIDWHAHKLHTKEAVEFFGEMAQKYGNQPNVIYEIFNEPEGDAKWPQLKDYATAVIGAIRKHDPDNLVIVGCPEWDQRIDLVAADPLKDQSNVMYSVHFYAATHGQWLRARTQAAINAGIPVIVTESSGSQASGQGNNKYAEWNAWIDFMDKNRISWLNYSVSDKAGETISVLRPQANASGNWSGAELTESGQQVRGLLRSYCEAPSVEQRPPAVAAEASDVPAARSVEQPWMSLKEWRTRHDAQLAAPERAAAQVALVGDSITQMWADTDAYHELLPYKPLNLGIGGDQTQHVLWRLEHGSLQGTSPKVIVLLIGVNNLGNGHSPEQTARGVLAVVHSLRDKAPGAKILLLSILPTGAQPTDPMRQKVIETNRLLEKTVLPARVTLHDVGASFLEPDGSISSETMGDALHPTPSGFARLTRAVQPLIEQAMSGPK